MSDLFNYLHRSNRLCGRNIGAIILQNSHTVYKDTYDFNGKLVRESKYVYGNVCGNDQPDAVQQEEKNAEYRKWLKATNKITSDTLCYNEDKDDNTDEQRFTNMVFDMVNNTYHEEFDNYWNNAEKGKLIIRYKYRGIPIIITQTNNKFVLTTKHIEIIIYNRKNMYIMKK